MKKQKNNDQWRGYSLSELRFQRALNKLRLEMEKERLRAAFSPAPAHSGFSLANIADTAGRYFDIAVLGFTIFRRISAFFRRFRRG